MAPELFLLAMGTAALAALGASVAVVGRLVLRARTKRRVASGCSRERVTGLLTAEAFRVRYCEALGRRSGPCGIAYITLSGLTELRGWAGRGAVDRLMGNIGFKIRERIGRRYRVARIGSEIAILDEGPAALSGLRECCGRIADIVVEATVEEDVEHLVVPHSRLTLVFDPGCDPYPRETGRPTVTYVFA